MLTIYRELEQGSDEWHAARCGLITASEMHKLLTPTLKLADNEKTRAHIYELAAQRISQYVEPSYIGDNALRGYEDEIKARDLYSEHYAPVDEIGGMVRDFGSYKVWCSPDGLVGDDGGIECKSRLQRFQIEVISKHEVPVEHVLQVQTSLFVSGRDWWDYVSYCGGYPPAVIRCEPIERYQSAIKAACEAAEERIAKVIEEYKLGLTRLSKVIKTERSVDIMEVYDGRE